MITYIDPVHDIDAVNILPTAIAAEHNDQIGPGQRSRFLVLITRSAASWAGTATARPRFEK